MKVLILAGGGGTRLFPLSRGQYPKQFLEIFDETSLLIQSVARAKALVPESDIVIVSGKEMEFHVKNELIRHGYEKVNLLLEPEARDTAAAIALGIRYCEEVLSSNSEEVVLVATSDHLISSHEEFKKDIDKAVELASVGYTVVLGVEPEEPETGYGYIEAGESFKQGKHVIAFKEKPNLETAQAYIAAGNYFWNSGMYLFRMDGFWKEIAEHAPEMYSIFDGTVEEIKGRFSELSKISIDYALAERSSKMAMVPLSCSWNDIGSWDAIYQVMEKDEEANAKQGDILAIDCKNSLFLGKKRCIAGIGLEDLLVVETDDVILITKRGDSQKVKQVVEHLKATDRTEADYATTVYRPWGSYTILDEGTGYKVKRIVVNPGASLSLQLHHHRSEHWVVTGGIATVQIGETEHMVNINESVYVPVETKHRLHNQTNEPVEIIEVQNGKYLGEDDIVRFDDVYGR